MKATPSEQTWARMVASMITKHGDLWQRAGRVKGGDESVWERFYEQQRNRENMIGFYICNFSGGNPARFLRLVAEILDGKTLHGAPHDDVILKATEIARERRLKRSRERRLKNKESPSLDVEDLLPLPVAEVDPVYIELTKARFRLTDRQLRRRSEVLNQISSPDHRTYHKRKRKRKLPRRTK
jgi:hypothetical protein